MQVARALAALVPVLVLASCGSSGSGGTAAVGGTGGSSTVHGGACDLELLAHPIEGNAHVTTCSLVTYATNPPSSGDHYPIWAAYKAYPAPIPRGFWVHDLEHGAVVVTYNCPAGCPDELAAIAAWAQALPPDHACEATPIQRRLVITPDPALDVRFAASAWGATLRAPCFDAPAFTEFFRVHVGQGPEVVCAEGVDLAQTPPAAGCGP